MSHESHKAENYALDRLEKILAQWEIGPIKPEDTGPLLKNEIIAAYLAGYFNGIVDSSRKETPQIERHKDKEQVN